MASDSVSGPDPTLYLYTSLTAGSSHIITATSRMETILKANKVAFRAIDCATDEKARNLWSRRSKGRKIPGLVKYGQVVGDLKEVEEWNEYGELRENIDNVSDLFGDTPMTDTPMPPPAPITLKDPLAKTSGPPSRSSSETRHISISEPKDRDREGSTSAASSARNSKDGTPMSLAMRQAGVEAAAKAGQRKASATSALKSASTASAPSAKRDSTDTTSSVAATKASIEAKDPAQDPEITDAKTPARLATLGAKKVSVDKIADESETSSGASSPDSDHKSNEEQLLEARRTSSVAKVPSRLQQETSVDDFKTPKEQQAVSGDVNFPGKISTTSDGRPTQYRGRSLSQASKEEIERIEKQQSIQEESEESDEDDSSEDEEVTTTKNPTTTSTIGATDKAEAAVMKGTKTQAQKTKDANAASVSASNALFLSPNHDPNPNRLSADSASVYSFFDSAFSPAPLFSGSNNLDLDLSFIADLKTTSDPRTSISTYTSNYTDHNNPEELPNGNSHDDTPKQSIDTQRTRQEPNEDSPSRINLPAIPTIAPLRTPARRQVSEPLLTSTLSSFSTPTSVPLPLKIRKSPTNTSISSGSPEISQPRPSTSQSHSQTQTQTRSQIQTKQHQNQATSPSALSPQPTNSTISPTSPSTPLTPISTTTTPTESRTLRFKKSIRSLRSKKSTQKLGESPTREKETPPDLPPQRQLKSLGLGVRSVSDSYAMAGSGEGRKREKSGVKNLLCF